MRTAVFWWLALAVASLCVAVYGSPDLQHAIGAASTALVRPIVVPLLVLMNVPAFVYVVALVILLAGLAACVGYRLTSVRPHMKQLRAVRVGVSELPIPSKFSGKSDWGSASHALGQLLSDNDLFIYAWSQFQAESSGRGAVPRAPFSNYVATEPEAVKNNSVLMRALPGYFTSLGLIMTFLGLVVALYFAAKGFRSGNVEDARAAIIQLLNAASFKFLTSVAALIAAFFISIFLRYNLSMMAGETRRTVERIEVFLTAWREHVGTGQTRSVLSDDVSARLDDLSRSIQELTAVIVNARLGGALREDRLDAVQR